MSESDNKGKVKITIDEIVKFNSSDLIELCEATENAINDNKSSFNIGLKRSEPLIRSRLENYWKGITLVEERRVFVGRIDGAIASSIQLIKPNPNNQTSSFACSVDQHFVASWARKHGLAKKLLETAEKYAKKHKFSVVRLKVNSSLKEAVSLYESMGYKKWGELDKYEIIDGKMQSGYFYYKDI